MITVRLPAMLRGDDGAEEIQVEEGVANISQLVSALDRLRPGLGDRLHDSLYNFAVNDALILHGADDYPVAHGDIVEIVPTIAGG
ncbi:MAG: MoaD/ThiS family protein [Vicinamibacterales bacterium]